jgi:hypothetical protein
VLAATTTRTFDVGHPSALNYKRAEYFCGDRVSGPGKRYVKILSHRSARGGDGVSREGASSANLPSPRRPRPGPALGFLGLARFAGAATYFESG